MASQAAVWFLSGLCAERPGLRAAWPVRAELRVLTATQRQAAGIPRCSQGGRTARDASWEEAQAQRVLEVQGGLWAGVGAAEVHPWPGAPLLLPTATLARLGGRPVAFGARLCRVRVVSCPCCVHSGAPSSACRTLPRLDPQGEGPAYGPASPCGHGHTGHHIPQHRAVVSIIPLQCGPSASPVAAAPGPLSQVRQGWVEVLPGKSLARRGAAPLACRDGSGLGCWVFPD